MQNIVYFDLETQKSFRDVGGYSNLGAMGVSIAVTYSTQRGTYEIYGENDLQALIDELTHADLVVGWNHEQFDYGVLQPNTIFDILPQTKNLDMMLDIEATLGKRLPLDNVAAHTLGTGKTGSGTDALKWWQDYKKTGDEEHLMKIASYCCYDVKVTMGVHQYGMEHGMVKFSDKNTGEIKEIGVSW